MFSLSFPPFPYLFLSIRLHRKTQVQSILHQRMLYNIIARLEKKNDYYYLHFKPQASDFTDTKHITHI